MIDFRPVRLRKLVEPPEGHDKPQRPAKLGPRKGADYQANLGHWAALCDAPISKDARAFMKSDTSLALRGALVAKDEGLFAEYHHPMRRARWTEPRVHLRVNGSSELRDVLERAISKAAGEAVRVLRVQFSRNGAH